MDSIFFYIRYNKIDILDCVYNILHDIMKGLTNKLWKTILKQLLNILILISLITLLNIGIRLLFVVAVLLDCRNDQSATEVRLCLQ